METVNKVVDASYKAIWGEDAHKNEQTEGSAPSGSSDGQTSHLTGIDSIDKVVDAGKKALWGENENIAHGEEPISGVRGLGTPTDPYDAGNRDDQPNAPSINAGSLPTSTPGVEQTAVGTTAAKTISTTPDPLKTTVTSLQPDPQAPGNAAADLTSKAVVDSGPVPSLKSTSEPLKEESERLAEDLKHEPTVPTGITTASSATATPVHTSASKATDSSSSSASSNNNNSGNDGSTHKRTKSKTLDKVKEKLHIGKHSTKDSK